MATQRGQIRNRQYATQVRDFSGLRFGNMTATDVDGMIEYRNKGYVFIETKFGDHPLPFGQRLALARLCHDLQNTKPTLLVVASHESDGDIDVTNTTVTEYRYKGKWRERAGTTGQLVAAFIASLDKVWER